MLASCDAAAAGGDHHPGQAHATRRDELCDLGPGVPGQQGDDPVHALAAERGWDRHLAALAWAAIAWAKVAWAKVAWAGCHSIRQSACGIVLAHPGPSSM